MAADGLMSRRPVRIALQMAVGGDVPVKGMRVETVDSQSVVGLPLVLVVLRIKSAAAQRRPQPGTVCFHIYNP